MPTTHTLHWSVDFGIGTNSTGENLVHKTMAGTATLNDAEDMAANLGLEVGVSQGVAIPDGHNGDEIKWSGSLGAQKLFGFLNIPFTGEGQADVYITEDTTA